MLVESSPSCPEAEFPPTCSEAPWTILSFDVEEHDRIEAAVGLPVNATLKADYAQRVGVTTRRLLELLEQHAIKATFFVLGDLAQRDRGLVRAIHDAGHEVASHGWDHRRVLVMNPDEFRDDLQRSKETLEQITGAAVVGYRAPTFSIVPRTAWALDVLAESGLRYDSSIYPVRHDRYGVPSAPRAPFWACGRQETILELPPVTLRLAGVNLPAGGGGYFRLLPLWVLEAALAQTHRICRPPVAMLYLHPWEFDPDQPRLPLSSLRRFRTYVGIHKSSNRLATLIARHQFTRAVDVVDALDRQQEALPSFALSR